MESLSIGKGIDLDLLRTFFVFFALDDFYPKRMSLEEIIHHEKRGKIIKSVQQALDFFNKMNEINILLNH